VARIRSKRDPVANLEARARLEMRETLGRLVGRFGYAMVKDSLLGVKRETAQRKQANLQRNGGLGWADPKKPEREYQKRLHVWLAVEEARRVSRPILSGKEAARRLAKGGGIRFFASGDMRRGSFVPEVKSSLRTAGTIEREWKRAEAALRKSDQESARVWRGLLDGQIGVPHPVDGMAIPWRQFRWG
jgi:hypothetical protein